jgi:hypothetical protein
MEREPTPGMTQEKALFALLLLVAFYAASAQRRLPHCLATTASTNLTTDAHALPWKRVIILLFFSFKSHFICNPY